MMVEAKIYQDLKNDHDKHRALFDKLQKTNGDNSKRRELFEDLRTELQAHAAAEEEALYSTMLKDPDLRDSARHSVAEHKEIDDLLGELMEADMNTSDWEDKFGGLQHRYIHHIDEEEEEMFPEAAAGLSSAEEKEAARTFEERKPKELEIAEEQKPGDDRD